MATTVKEKRAATRAATAHSDDGVGQLAEASAEAGLRYEDDS